MRKRMLTMFLTICVIVTMLPVNGLAMETPMEPASTGQNATPSSVTDSFSLLSTGSVTTVGTEAELVNAMSASGTGDVVALGADISMNTQLTVGRSVTLDLNGHKLAITLNGEIGIYANGIKIASGVTLTIRDSSDPSIGTLDVANYTSSADIGYKAAINTTDGTLVIESGTVTAKGGYYGAGIGGSGTVIISGGTVTATGGLEGAGIGGGGDYSNGGTVTISGGTVTATGGIYGAGIGGGSWGPGVTVTISGGTVIATGGDFGAGIGGPYDRTGGTLTITGGSVNANNMEMGNAAKPQDADGSPLYLATLTVKGSDPIAGAMLDSTGHMIKTSGGFCTYGTNDVNTDTEGKVYFYLPADIYSVYLKVGGKLYANESVSVMDGSSNAADLILSKTLVSITPPAAITGLLSGTPKTPAALGLPAHVTLVTDDGNVDASVTWDVGSCPYDPTSAAAQTFTVNGTVTLPNDVLNLNGVSLNVSVSVTVNAAPSSSEPTFTARTLTDANTGLTVSGKFAKGAALRVVSFTPARSTTDPALAAIVKRMDSLQDTLIFCADISISGNYSGPLMLSFEVGSQYNGQTVTLLHVKNGKLVTYTTVVKDGIATFTVDSLSPFALFAPVTALNVLDIPKTGDGGMLYGVIVLGIAALALGIALMQKRRTYKKES